MMRVNRQLSHTSNSSNTEQSPVATTIRENLPHTQDTISSHPLSSNEEEGRSALKIVIEYFLSMPLVIWIQIRKIFSLFFYNTPNASIVRNAKGISQEASNDFENLSFEVITFDSLEACKEDSISSSHQHLSLSQFNLTDAQKSHIFFVINTLANASLFNMPKSELEKRGENLLTVHPFVYLKFILCDESLLANFKTIKTRNFGVIWAQYIQKFASRLQNIHQKGLLLPYLQSFAEDTGRDYKIMKTMIKNCEFQAFTEFLLQDPTSTPQTPSPTAMIASLFDAPSPSENTSSTESAESLEPPVMPDLTRSVNLAHLIMPETHKKKLSTILETVAHGNSFTLFLHIISIKSDWNKLKEIHPLKLLMEVFGTPTHVSNLSLILQSPLRKNHFMADFIMTLKKGTTKEILAPYIDEFCRQMGVEVNCISDYLLKEDPSDWTNLIKYMLQKKMS